MCTNKFDFLWSKNPRFLNYVGKLVSNESSKKKKGRRKTKREKNLNWETDRQIGRKSI